MNLIVPVIVAGQPSVNLVVALVVAPDPPPDDD